MAYSVRSATECRSSFRMRFVRWVSAVFTLSLRATATSLLVLLRRGVNNLPFAGVKTLSPRLAFFFLMQVPVQNHLCHPGRENVLRCCKASTAATRSRAASDLSTKPRAPAAKTSRTTCSASCIVRIRILIAGDIARICRAASRPFNWAFNVEKSDIWFGVGGQLDGSRRPWPRHILPTR